MDSQGKILPETRKKYGYKMFDCTVSDFSQYLRDCYRYKKKSTPEKKYDFVRFTDVDSAINMIRNIFIPKEHEHIAEISWSLEENNTLLVKQIAFREYESQELYQNAVERAWALGGHLDTRVHQIYY